MTADRQLEIERDVKPSRDLTSKERTGMFEPPEWLAKMMADPAADVVVRDFWQGVRWTLQLGTEQSTFACPKSAPGGAEAL